jgi:peroxiredoxin
VLARSRAKLNRTTAIAFVVAFVAATAATAAVFAFGTETGPPLDGEAELTDPGEYVQPEASVPVTGDIVPDVELVDVAGEVTTLAGFRGDPLVVNVWYSTCAPCAREIREFATVDAEVGDRVRFVGINPLDDTDRMLEFAEARGVEYELLRDPGLEWVNAVPIGVYPTTLFVSPDGEILRQTTAIDAAELRTILAEVFDITT